MLVEVIMFAGVILGYFWQPKKTFQNHRKASVDLYGASYFFHGSVFGKSG